MSIPSDTLAQPAAYQATNLLMPNSEIQPTTTIRQKLSNGLNQWKTFWFKPSDPLMLAVIRLLTAGLLFYNLCVWTLDFDAFFSANGLQPLETVRNLYQGSPIFSFWFYIPEPWLWTAHLACLAIVFLFFTGTATRATSLLSYLITISYSQRLPVANFGLDQILGLLCLYLAVGPCGACLSVDSLFRKLKTRWKHGNTTGQQQAQERIKSSSATVALRLIQIHLCVIYFWAGFAKLKGDTWFTGEAMWNVIANLEYQTTDLTWMAYVPWLPYLVAHVTVIWELFFCVLVWNRTLRPLVLLIGTGMHFGIGAFLGMWTFGLAMTFCYFAFSDPAVWRRAWGRRFWNQRFSDVLVNVPSAANPNKVTVAAASSLAADENDSVAEQADQAMGASMPVDTTVVAAAAAVQEIDASPNTVAAMPETEAALPANMSADSVVANSDQKKGSLQGLPRTELLIVALRERHRNSLQGYFQNHSVPCRLSATVDLPELNTPALQPAAILVMASELSTQQLVKLLDDLQADASVPIMVVVSEAMMADFKNHSSTVSFLVAPVTLKEIHEELIQTIWRCHDDQNQTSSVSNPIDP